MAKLTGTRSWPVRANALLLVLQAAGLGGIGAYSVYRVDWQEVQQQVDTYATLSQGLTEAVEQAVIVVLILGVPAILALLAAFGLLLLFRMGWLLAMIVQSLTLLACLLLYAWTGLTSAEIAPEILYEEPVFIYPVMLYCIVMALYLNSSDVRAAFQVRRRGEAGRVARGL